MVNTRSTYRIDWKHLMLSVNLIGWWGPHQTGIKDLLTFCPHVWLVFQRLYICNFMTVITSYNQALWLMYPLIYTNVWFYTWYLHFLKPIKFNMCPFLYLLQKTVLDFGSIISLFTWMKNLTNYYQRDYTTQIWSFAMSYEAVTFDLETGDLTASHTMLRTYYAIHWMCVIVI